MRFQNGNWLMKEGYARFSPKQVFETERDAHQLILRTPTKGNGGINGIMLTLRITAPAPEVIRVQTWHYMGMRHREPEFELNLADNALLQIDEDEETLTVHSGHLSLVIGKKEWFMRYERDGKLVTKSDSSDLAYIKTDWKGDFYSYNGDAAYMTQQLGLSVGELIYGLGERFTPFVKNGQTVDVWNEDGGTGTDQSYKNIPFYLSTRGYGVFVNHPEKVSYEIASESVTKVGISVPGEYLDYFLIDGPTMKDALVRYTDLTGKPSLPPEWTFGPWLSTSFVTSYDEKTVMSFIDGMLDRGIPLSVFHFDCLWMKLFHWTDFLWDSKIFPDPEGMLRRIHEKGIKVCVWINPYIAQASVLFEEGVKGGYFLKRANGDVWQWDMWQPGMAIVDFTNPEACRWFSDKLKGLMAMGVDCFKTDFGERIPTDAVYFNNADPEKMHNYYSYIYNKTVYETIESVKGKGEAVLFARSATVGGQQFPVHWGGDCNATYESMGESLRGGLSLTSSGFGFWSHDIGSFENTATPDLYKRWSAFGLLSSHSRFHGSSSYRVPWVFDEESVDVVRFFARLKMSLMPYLYAQAVRTSVTGLPLMHSMVMDFTDDLNCHYLDRQYMFGENIMIAPIFNAEGIGQYYLPEGAWTDYLTGEAVQGGRWYEKKYDYLSIPMFVKENSIIAQGSRDDVPEYDYSDHVEFRVYEPSGEAQSVIYEHGIRTASLKSEFKDGCLKLTAQIKQPYSIRLVNRLAAGGEGGDFEIQGNDTVIKPHGSVVSCTIR